jgi:tetratricopeptide (TPR) repeat protein
VIPALLVLLACLLPAAEVCDGPAQRTPAGYLEAGECFLRTQDWEQAEAQLRTYLRHNPASARATALHAQALVHLSHPFDAVLEVEAFLKKDPDSAQVLKVYAELLERVVKDIRKSDEVLERLTKLTPGDAGVWRTLGTHYLVKELPDQALRCYRQATRLAPDDAIAAAGLGAAYSKIDRNAEADAQFARAVRLNERSAKPLPLVYLICAESLLAANRASESLAMATKALTLDAHSVMGYYWRAASYERLEDHRYAEGDARAALREGGGDQKQVHNLLLRIYRSQQNMEAAQREAAEVARLADVERTEHERAATISTVLRQAEPLLREGKFAEAAKHYEELVSLLPTFYEAYFALGICYSQTSRPAEAETALRKFLSLQPLSADGHSVLGVLLIEQKRNAEAAPELEEAIRLDPGHIEARKALAANHFANSDYEKAAGILRPVADTSGADTQLLMMLAEALFRTRNRDGALREVDRVLATEPSNAAALALKQALSRP